MNALPTAAALLLAATLATEPTQSKMPSRVSQDVNAALSRHESRAIRDASAATAFAATAAQDGMTEVALGVLALRRSSNWQVRLFAQRMVEDHGRAIQELLALVERKGLILPTELDAKYAAMVRSLDRKSNAAFDKAYVELVGKSHAQVIAWFESASRSSDSDVAGFAHKTLATLQEHKELAEQLHASMGIGTASARRLDAR